MYTHTRFHPTKKVSFVHILVLLCAPRSYTSSSVDKDKQQHQFKRKPSCDCTNQSMALYWKQTACLLTFIGFHIQTALGPQRHMNKRKHAHTHNYPRTKTSKVCHSGRKKGGFFFSPSSDPGKCPSSLYCLHNQRWEKASHESQYIVLEIVCTDGHLLQWYS